MDQTGMIPGQIASGWLLILSGMIFIAGGMLYTGRAIWKWAAGQTHRYLILERGSVIAALLVLIVGLNLLEKMLEHAGDGVLASSGMVLLLVAASVVIYAEANFISRNEWNYAATVVFVVLTFLAQAIFGASLLRTGLLPPWVGWTALLWNLVWLVVLPIARPRDMYYPWLHYAAPVLIGIELLVTR